MLYIVIFFILSSSICIYSKTGWENLVDRLDLLFVESYLIIQCNEKEIQITRALNTFEELKSNLKCTNKNDLFKYGSDRVQIVNLLKATITCKNNKLIQIIGSFIPVKSALKKEENGIDWPYIHTQFTREIGKKEPIKMKFEKNQIEFFLSQIHIDELLHGKYHSFIYLEFVNRPMVCRISIESSENFKAQDDSCNSIRPTIIEVRYPMCYYKFGGKNSPSHKEIDEIIDKTFPYVQNKRDNYIYISTNIIHSNNITEKPNLTSKVNKSEQVSSESKNEEKTSSMMIYIIIIIGICLIVIIIGIILFCQKYSKETEDKQLPKQKSSSSDESQISIESNKSQKDFTLSSLKQIHNNKPKHITRTTTNWFKLDEDI